MLIFGQKTSPILNSSETTDITCNNCGKTGIVSFHHYIEYACITFGIPIFPMKSHVMSSCNACLNSILEEDFSPEIKQACAESALSKTVPIKYYGFGLVIFIYATIDFIIHESYSKSTGSILFSIFNIAFLACMIWGFSIAFKRLDKNPYLAFLVFIPAIGFFVVIVLLIYYYYAQNDKKNYSYKNRSFQPNYTPKSSNEVSEIPKERKKLSQQEFKELVENGDSNLTLTPIEYSYLLESIVYNLVWYVRIHKLDINLFNMDSLIKNYPNDILILNAAKNAASAEEMASLTNIIENRNGKIKNNYPPIAVTILLQYVILLHLEQAWVLENFTLFTQKLLRTFDYAKINMKQDWFEMANRLGMKWDITVDGKKTEPNTDGYTINNIFFSYYFYVDTILILQLWYLRSNNCNPKNFDLIKDKFPELQQRLEQIYWEFYDMPLENVKNVVLKHIKIVFAKFNTKLRQNILFEVATVQKQPNWKMNFYTDATGELLQLFRFSSLQFKTTWNDILNMTPDATLFQQVSQQNNSQFIDPSVKNFFLEIQEAKDQAFLVMTSLYINIWYLRENGLQPNAFMLSDDKNNTVLINRCKELYLNDLKIEELEYRTFGRIRALNLKENQEAQQYLIQKILYLHSQQVWNLPHFTEITSDLLGVLEIEEHNKQDIWLWQSAIFQKQVLPS